MNKERFSVAVVGATGAVGEDMIRVLERRDFPIAELLLLASANSIGKRLSFKDDDYKVVELTTDVFDGVDIALFSAGAARSIEFAPAAVRAGAVVVDNSSAFRMDPAVPLVVPEVNREEIFSHHGIIANPNCSTIQMVVCLKPIHDAVGIKRVVVSTYQSVSGTGKKAIEELADQTRALLNMQEPELHVYPYRIAFNCLPHIDDFTDSGYTKEEVKMVNETKKILGDDSIAVSATCVRVPVFYGHSESVNVETHEPLNAERCRELLAEAPGVVVVDQPEKAEYPLVSIAADRDEVFVGRIREDQTVENAVNMWIVADNIRKGAALNAVQIAEVVAVEML